jgi:uncharacterized protein
MPNNLGNAVSPYLRSHADNPVYWQQWGSGPFAEAERRQVPVMISIGYSTCHWCPVMARESFSDPVLAEYLNDNFVSIKVDREEYPDVDSTYLAAAGAFTDQLGWPLTVFVTPGGRAFFAGTYFPPVELPGRVSFRQVLEAVVDAWSNRRDEVDSVASGLAEALAAQTDVQAAAHGDSLPTESEFAAAIDELRAYEDVEFGGFGGAPKFPVAPVIGFLLDREDGGDVAAGALARRALDAMAVSPLRDAVEGGFFRYAVQRDWSEPHYERMLYDNSLLLDAYSRAGRAGITEGIASFLLGVLRLPSGGFASAQDSESTVDGQRVEGGYYALDADGRAKQTPPALDDKVLTGWNGLAIGALASAGARLGHPEWIAAAERAADLVASGDIVRARIDGAVSSARATLEDYGMLAAGLVDLALATGDARHAVRARELVTAALREGGPAGFGVPGGGDPVLADHGLVLEVDPSEGAYPSGLSAIARAAGRLHLLTGDRAFLLAATQAMAFIAPLATPRPISFGGALSVMSGLAAAPRQLVVVADDPDALIAAAARNWRETGSITTIVTSAQAEAFASAGFELYEARGMLRGEPTAYLCSDFVCELPVTEVSALDQLLSR